MTTGSEGFIALEILDNRKAFSPGEEICGVLRWSMRKKEPIELHFGWYAEGGLNRDVMSHCSRSFYLTEYHGSEPFSCTVPKGPYSYEGELFSVKWMIEARTKDRRYVCQLPLSVGSKPYPSGDEKG